MRKIILPILFVLFAFGSLLAQDDFVELLRKDIDAEKVAVISDVMAFTDEESAIFWPIYREYDLNRKLIADKRIALIKYYAENFDSITDEKADDIAKQTFKIREQFTKLEKKYYKKMAKALTPRTAARFIQLDGQINSLITLQLTSQLPLIEH